MRYSFPIALIVGLTVAGAASADVGIAVPNVNLQKTAPAISVMAGLGLAALLVFGGVWGLRHPVALLGALLAIPGALLMLAGGTILFDGSVGGLICLLPGLGMIGGGLLLMAKRPPFLGRSLVYFLLAGAGAIVFVIAVSQMTWIDPRAESRERFRQQREREQQKTHPATPEKSAE